MFFRVFLYYGKINKLTSWKALSSLEKCWANVSIGQARAYLVLKHVTEIHFSELFSVTFKLVNTVTKQNKNALSSSVHFPKLIFPSSLVTFKLVNTSTTQNGKMD
jgi:hypothetical protein